MTTGGANARGTDAFPFRLVCPPSAVRPALAAARRGRCCRRERPEFPRLVGPRGPAHARAARDRSFRSRSPHRNRSRTSASVSWTCRRSRFTCLPVGGSAVRNSGVRLPAPNGSEIASSGSTSRPSTSSIDPPPMSISSSRPADQPYQRRTAKYVRRASSSPERNWGRIPDAASIRSMTSSRFVASRIAAVTNG